ncbi:MAG: rhodanese-like domain-containing protein [Deltaproteobacteria bacterium]|nr:rhodanese-like domain-containing protein [Deltaproteobacteria bacterium]
MKGWMDAFLAIETDSKLLQNIMLANQNNPAEWVIGIDQAKALRNPTLVDFRSADKFEKEHVENAVNIPYEELWAFANLEKLNKSKELVIIHDDPVVAGILAVSFRLLEYRTYILN